MFWNYSTGRFLFASWKKKINNNNNNNSNNNNKNNNNKRITTKLSHYHLIKQIRKQFFYPEMWSISQKTNLKKTYLFLAGRLLIKI